MVRLRIKKHVLGSSKRFPHTCEGFVRFFLYLSCLCNVVSENLFYFCVETRTCITAHVLSSSVPTSSSSKRVDLLSTERSRYLLG